VWRLKGDDIISLPQHEIKDMKLGILKKGYCAFEGKSTATTVPGHPTAQRLAMTNVLATHPHSLSLNAFYARLGGMMAALNDLMNVFSRVTSILPMCATILKQV
jgi:hypothetical protein